MKTVQIAVSALKAPERNVRLHTEKQIVELARSVKMFGQIRPIVVDENNIVLAGNGLVEALKQLEIKIADCYMVTGLSENDKKKLMLADNKIFALGMDLAGTQFDFIREIGDLDIPGFDKDIIATLLSNAQEITERIGTYGSVPDDVAQARKEVAEADTGSTVAPDTVTNGRNIVCPHCGQGIWIP